MSEEICTIHQRLDSSGHPIVAGSEVRMPDGSVIPCVQSVTVHAEAGERWWEVTLKLKARFGEPIRLESLQSEAARTGG